MGIITKSTRKYTYILDKGSKNYNPFFDGTVWTAENIDGLDDYVRLSSVERSETENSSAISKKIVTIPKTRLMSDFTKICEQDIQPEFKKNDNVDESVRKDETRDVFPDDDDNFQWLAANFSSDDDADNCDEDETDSWWSNKEIEKFMQNYNVDHSLLWTDKEINEYTGKCKCNTKGECLKKCDSKPKPAGDKKPRHENYDEVRSLVEDALSLMCRVFECLG